MLEYLNFSRLGHLWEKNVFAFRKYEHLEMVNVAICEFENLEIRQVETYLTTYNPCQLNLCELKKELIDY